MRNAKLYPFIATFVNLDVENFCVSLSFLSLYQQEKFKLCREVHQHEQEIRSNYTE